MQEKRMSNAGNAGKVQEHDGKWESKKVYNEYLEWRSKTSAEIFAELGASADPLKIRYCEIKSL